MCNTRHFATVLALTMIPEEMRTAFMILRQAVLKQNVYMKAGRPAEA